MHEGATFVGGMRWPAGTGTLGGNATIPFVRLRVEANGLHLAPNGGLARAMGAFSLMPSYDFPWSEIQRVERLRRGVRLVTAQLEAPVLFWTPEPDRVLNAISNHGAVVDHQTQPVYGRPRIALRPFTRTKLVGIGVAMFTTVSANTLWTFMALPVAVVMPLRVFMLIACAASVLAITLLPADYWTRGH